MHLSRLLKVVQCALRKRKVKLLTDEEKTLFEGKIECVSVSDPLDCGVILVYEPSIRRITIAFRCGPSASKKLVPFSDAATTAAAAAAAAECGKVRRSYAKRYASMRQIILNWIRLRPHEKVLCVGHSSGAALAAIASLNIANVQGIRPTCVLFGCPDVGDAAFTEALKAVDVESYVTEGDLVAARSTIPVTEILKKEEDSKVKLGCLGCGKRSNPHSLESYLSFATVDTAKATATPDKSV
jgi:hypothetical protein